MLPHLLLRRREPANIRVGTTLNLFQQSLLFQEIMMMFICSRWELIRQLKMVLSGTDATEHFNSVCWLKIVKQIQQWAIL